MKVWQSTLLLAGMLGPVCARGQQSLAEANRLRGAAVMGPAVELSEVPEPADTLEDVLHRLFLQADVVFAGTVVKVEPAEGAVVIRFRVEDAVRGVTSGDVYVLREWSGLWADDPSRYVVGERRLMLLYAASSAGYASPAGGSLGAIHLRGDVVQQSADLRWLANEVHAAAGSGRAMGRSFSPAVNAVPENSAVDGMMITDILHAWQRAEVTR